MHVAVNPTRAGLQVGLVYRDGLDASNILLRGCTLRKTEWVIGVVVFTGTRLCFVCARLSGSVCCQEWCLMYMHSWCSHFPCKVYPL